MIKINHYILNINNLLEKLRTLIFIGWLKTFCDISIGKGTIIRELKYINTDNGSINIGKNCVINAIALAGPITIGDNTLVNLLSDISGRDHKVTIGSNVLISPHVTIMASMHNYKKSDELIRKQGTSGNDVIVEDDVWIGTNAIVLPGVRIGSGAVIGANSLVTHNIEPYSINVGSPTKIIGFRG